MLRPFVEGVAAPDQEAVILDHKVVISGPSGCNTCRAVVTPGHGAATPGHEVTTPNHEVATPDFEVTIPDFEVMTPDNEINVLIVI